jgi:hypothetical protein
MKPGKGVMIMCQLIEQLLGGRQTHREEKIIRYIYLQNNKTETKVIRSGTRAVECTD